MRTTRRSCSHLLTVACAHLCRYSSIKLGRMSLESISGMKTSTFHTTGGAAQQATYERPAPGHTSFLDDGGIEVQLGAGTAVVDSVEFQTDEDGSLSMEDHKDDARHYAGLMSTADYKKKKQIVLEASETHEEKVLG